MNSFATTMATPLTLLSALLMPSSTTVNNTTNNAARRRAAASRSEAPTTSASGTSVSGGNWRRTSPTLAAVAVFLLVAVAGLRGTVAVEYEVSVDEGISWTLVVPFSTNAEIIRHYDYSNINIGNNIDIPHYHGLPRLPDNTALIQNQNIAYLITAGDGSDLGAPTSLFLVTVMRAIHATDDWTVASFSFELDDKCPAELLSLPDVLAGVYPDDPGSFNGLGTTSPSFCQGGFGVCLDTDQNPYPTAGAGPIVFMEDRVGGNEPLEPSLSLADLKYYSDKIFIGDPQAATGLTWTSATDGFIMRMNSANEYDNLLYTIATQPAKFPRPTQIISNNGGDVNGIQVAITVPTISGIVGTVGIASSKIRLRTTKAAAFCSCDNIKPPMEPEIDDKGKILVCHKDINAARSGKSPLMVINPNYHAWCAHERHGDTLCPDASDKDCCGTECASDGCNLGEAARATFNIVGRDGTPRAPPEKKRPVLTGKLIETRRAATTATTDGRSADPIYDDDYPGQN